MSIFDLYLHDPEDFENYCRLYECDECPIKAECEQAKQDAERLANFVCPVCSRRGGCKHTE